MLIRRGSRSSRDEQATAPSPPANSDVAMFIGQMAALQANAEHKPLVLATASRVLELAIADRAKASLPPPPLADPLDGFRPELGNQSLVALEDMPIALEKEEDHRQDYNPKFLGRPHYVWVGSLRSGNHRGHADGPEPVVIGIRPQTAEIFEGFIWTSWRHQQIYLEKRLLTGLKPANILSKICELQPSLLAAKQLQQVDFEDVTSQIVAYEAAAKSPNYKFGVLYCLPGQTEDQMYGNKESTPEFEAFLNFLGEKIELRGYSGFKGGLDTKRGSTGSHSYVSSLGDYNIMFHVSTLLPYTEDTSATNGQQLERKRHLGNDIVIFIFCDKGARPSPKLFASHFNHIFILVAPAPNDSYQIAVCSKRAVGPFGPILPKPATFKIGPFLRKWLLSKAINGERAAQASPVFSEKLLFARKIMLEELCSVVKQSKRKPRELPGFQASQSPLIDRISLFSSLPVQKRNLIAAVVQYKVFAAAAAILTEGEAPEAFYMIEEGTTSVTIAKEEGTVELTKLGPGSYFGEKGLLDGTPRSATVTAVTEVKVGVICKADFQALVSPLLSSELAAQIRFYEEREKARSIRRLQFWKKGSGSPGVPRRTEAPPKEKRTESERRKSRAPPPKPEGEAEAKEKKKDGTPKKEEVANGEEEKEREREKPLPSKEKSKVDNTGKEKEEKDEAPKRRTDVNSKELKKQKKAEEKEKKEEERLRKAEAKKAAAEGKKRARLSKKMAPVLRRDEEDNWI